MQAKDFSVLNLSRYQLRLKAQRAVMLPLYLGSTLCGAFGHALKEAVCVAAHRNCERCMLAERCIYPYLFETPAPPIEWLRNQRARRLRTDSNRRFIPVAARHHRTQPGDKDSDGIDLNAPRTILAAVHGSVRLDVNYRGLIDRASSVRTRASGLHWRDWKRYSNRQRVKMNMGGFLGRIEYAGEVIQEFIPLIIAGKILHVGTGTSFGLGRYEVIRNARKAPTSVVLVIAKGVPQDAGSTSYEPAVSECIR
ncbi:MAG: CRISPR system precrRNA processing endoribonuclease RAMP protein Cas6 [Blastocatellia bacterium]